MNINIGQKGQTLIEVLVAIILAAILMVFITNIIKSTYDNLNENQNNAHALQFAQEGMEYLRSEQNIFLPAIATGISSNTPYCLDVLATSSFTSPATASLSSRNACSSLLADPSANIHISYLRTFTVSEGVAPCTEVPPVVYKDYLVEVDTGWHDARQCTGSSYYCRVSRITTCLSNTTALPTQF